MCLSYVLPFESASDSHVQEAHWDSIVDLSKVASQADFLVEDQDVMANAETFMCPLRPV